MQVFHSIHQVSLPPRGSCVALGFFDGLHPGHRTVIESTVALARQRDLTPCVFTFTMDNGHPAAKPAAGRLVSPSMRDHLLEEIGITHVLCPPFGEFRSMTPEEYVEILLHRILKAEHVFTGENYHFGKAAAGNVADLRRLGAAYGIGADTMPMLVVDGEPVSSTRIRGCIAAGDMAAARRLLDRWFTIDFAAIPADSHAFWQVLPRWFVKPRPGRYRSAVHTPDGKRQAVTQVAPPVGDGEVLCTTRMETPPPHLDGRMVVELREPLDALPGAAADGS